jgi:asparagine synthase (glutamine-hydrolysing)
MCGIVGVCARKGGIEEGDLARMRDTLSHRGPDDKGLWIDNDRRVGLAHRRLSIIDLSVAGHQPMVSDGGRSILSYNGEIYNFVELREELEEKGCRFKSRSDTEVILHAYDIWGIDAIHKLNGMFAFALYDQKKKQLVLARDRFGEKPLYYYVNRDLLIFASELKAIKSHHRFSLSGHGFRGYEKTSSSTLSDIRYRNA